MGALNVITGRVTNPGATLTALTMNTGDATTVKYFDASQPAWIIQAWGQTATAGVFRIRSPRLHDPNQGIRLRTATTVVRPLLEETAKQYIVPQDLLTVEGSGGGAETDVFSFMIYYQNLLQNAAHLITYEEYQARMVNISGAEVSGTSSATVGQYGGTTALNATFDNWKRNIDYAWLGGWADLAGCTIGVTGPDTGQVRIGLPMAVDPLVNYDFFVRMAQQNNLPLIPVINAANIAATSIDVATTAVSTAFNATLVMAELSGAGNASLL